MTKRVNFLVIFIFLSLFITIFVKTIKKVIKKYSLYTKYGDFLQALRTQLNIYVVVHHVHMSSCKNYTSTILVIVIDGGIMVICILNCGCEYNKLILNDKD